MDKAETIENKTNVEETVEKVETESEDVKTPEPVEASKTEEKTEQAEDKHKDERVSAHRLEYNGDRLFDNKRYEEASDYFRRALKIYEKISDQEGIARVTFNIGFSMEQVQKYDEAVKMYTRSKDMYKKLGNMQDYAVTADRTAKSYYWQGNSKDAIREYKESVETGAEISEIFNNMGFIHLEFKEYDEAKSALTKALELRKKEESRDVHVTYNNLGISHFMLADYKEAERYFREGVEADKKAEDEDRSVQYMIFAKPEYKGEKFENIRVFYSVNTKACILGNLATTLAMQEKNAESLEYVEKALDIDREQAYIREAAGWIYLKQGDETKALEQFRRASSYDPANEDIKKVIQMINPYIDVKAGRNDPCPCGSGKKFKKCHGAV
jgi:tetratricopeptide (TPR) repeat protein